jgi:hypothetical protein
MTLDDVEEINQRLRDLVAQAYTLEQAVRYLHRGGTSLLALRTAIESVAGLRPAHAHRFVMRCCGVLKF